jgi:membrane-bound inhibitor of C-type lysozyme
MALMNMPSTILPVLLRLRSVASLWAALACMLPLAAPAQTPATPPDFESVSRVYRCTGGTRLQVIYLNIKNGDSFATTYINGRLVLMRSGPTGSGARYVSVDEQLGYRWHVKGDVGNLFFLAADHTARETLLLQDCKVQRQP